MKLFPYSIILALLLAACGQQQKEAPAVLPVAASDDTTIYGLVCDGSNDTIIIYLREPYDGSDPDTLDILEASKQQQVFGTLRVGDRVAIRRDSADAHKASQIIVTQDLLGQWCYREKPTLKPKASMNSQDSLQLPDSLQQLLNTQLEYGFTLKIDSVAQPIWPRNISIRANEDSPIRFHQPKRYRLWAISDGQLLLTETSLDSLGNHVPIATDTVSLVLLTADSLVLRYNDGDHGFYRKSEASE